MAFCLTTLISGNKEKKQKKGRPTFSNIKENGFGKLWHDMTWIAIGSNNDEGGPGYQKVSNEMWLLSCLRKAIINVDDIAPEGLSTNDIFIQCIC